MATPIPANSSTFSAAEVSAVTGAELRVGRASEFTGVTTDSRGALAGKLFVALPGERYDGHDFAAAAVAAGAAGVLVSRELELDPRVTVLRAACTLTALGDLARAHRRRWGQKLIAVGGSAGKTTTKSAIRAALEARAPGAVHATPGNLNNRIGVPMVLLGLGPEHRFAVIEVGTNAPGEVAELARICEPDLAVLTLVALEHTEGLGDLDAIEAEEGALLAALPEHGAAIVNGDDARCRSQLARSPAAVKLTYGVRGAADYRVLEREVLGPRRVRARVERPRGPALTLETSLVGDAGALAVAAGLAVLEHMLGEPAAQELAEQLFAQDAVHEPGRLNPVELADGTLVLDDTYNANPASVLSSVRAAQELAALRRARLVLVIGEMRELGSLSRSLHRELGTTLATSGAAELIAVAGDARQTADAARASGLLAQFTSDCEQALERALQVVQPGDVVLVKASRGVHAERVVEGLAAAKGRAA